jgi:hypothetical protein
LTFVPAVAFAAVPPHVAESGSASPDACAICHRTHTANVELSYRTTASVDPTGNALIIAPASDYGTPGFPAPQPADVGLCFTCHGGGGLGSQYDVETSFTLESTHSIAPSTSEFGPSPKMCGSCHDPHGTDRVSGAPYPKLLRAWEGTRTVLSKEEYCAACHKARSVSRFDGLAVYEKTGHYSGMPDPANGTKIRCSNCHVAHGSSIAPLVVGQVVPPAAPDTLTVAANDRRLCVACHPDPKHSWSGKTTYALSAHALSTTRVPIPGEWPSAGATRRLGECQVCHAPMGRSDGSGGAIAKLLEKPGRALCDTCHQPGGPAKADLVSLATSEAGQPETAIVWGPDPRSGYSGRTDIYGRATAGDPPRELIGPRAYRTPDANGAAAVGDIDGDGQAEIVVGGWNTGSVTVFERDALLGLVGTSRAIGAGIKPDLVVVGRFVVPTVGEISGPRPQIAIVDIAAKKLWLYENMVGTALTLVPSGGADDWYALPDTATGIAAGDFAGGALQDLAVTTQGGLLLFTQSGTASQIEVIASVAAAGLRGPSIGDVNTDGDAEIVVCDTAGSAALVYGYSGGAATLLATRSLVAGQIPWATAVGEIYPGEPGNEIAVAVSGTDGRVSVFTAAGARSDASHAGAPESLSGSVLIADVDGDSTNENLVGNAGRWDAVAGMSPPSVDLYRPSGSTLVYAKTLFGGSELAGTAPALLSADFGPVLPSRHPVDVVASHVSTETGSFTRHVTCSDCHSSHEASSGIAATAPLVTGNMRGAWGTAVTNNGAGSDYAPSPAARATRQYEVCFKCHATTAGGREDVASKVNSVNPSVHAVEGVSARAVALDDSFEPGWSKTSVLYCTDCHGNSAGSLEAVGTHRSGAAPLLKSPVLGVAQDSASLLCYRCHKRTVYFTGALAADSWFNDGTSLHARHSGASLGFACSACHVSHGSATEPHLLRSDIGYDHETAGANSGSCDATACHATEHSYGP